MTCIVYSNCSLILYNTLPCLVRVWCLGFSGRERICVLYITINPIYYSSYRSILYVLFGKKFNRIPLLLLWKYLYTTNEMCSGVDLCIIWAGRGPEKPTSNCRFHAWICVCNNWTKFKYISHYGISILVTPNLINIFIKVRNNSRATACLKNPLAITPIINSVYCLYVCMIWTNHGRST